MTSIQHALTHESSTIQTMIAVVTKISVDAVNSKAQMLIADDSIPENSYARLSLSGSDTVTTSLAKVCAGDVFSFHGFQVTRHDSSKFPLVADFQSSWQEPGAGWTQLYASKIGGPVSCAQDRDAAKRVESLIDWCSRSKFNDSIPSLPACRRRRLSELHTVGMTSHVVVKVTSIDTADAPADCMSASRKKRKRWLPLKKHQTTIAVLSDGDDVMPFLECSTHETALKEAIQSGTTVLLTHVVTGKTNDDKMEENIALRPTECTTVIPMLNDGMSSSKRPNTDSTQPFISLTQDMPGSTIQSLSSPLRDIYIDELGVSLGDGKRFVSPNGFVSTLIDSSASQPSYRAATLTLDGVVVKADAKVIQTLCGSIDAATLLNHPRLKPYVTDLMRGLLEEQVDLTWTIEQQGDVYLVQKCFLPRI